MMKNYTVWEDNAGDMSEALFEGTFEECLEFKGDDEELYIEAPDGFTVVG